MDQKTIAVAEEVKEITPKEFIELENTIYKLQKLKLHDGQLSMIDEGQFVEGEASIITYEFADDGYLPMVIVVGVNKYGRRDLIKTSPIKSVVDTTSDSLTFTTETSTYKLSKVDLSVRDLRES